MSEVNRIAEADDPTFQKIEEFLGGRRDAGPVESWDELQTILRGETDVPALVVDFVKQHGEVKEVRGEDVCRLGVRAGKFVVNAEVSKNAFKDDFIKITSKKRMLPFMKFKTTQIVSLHTNSTDRDSAVLFRPQFESYLPEISSPQAINFWSERASQHLRGDTTLSLADSTEIAFKAARMASEASAEAKKSFNGFLDTATWMLDKLVHGEKI